MRRRTVNRNLARRAKDLVRKWQQLVAGQSSSFPLAASVAGPLASSNPSTSEISRVSSSGSLVDVGSQIQPTNGIQQPPNRSSNGPYTMLSTNEDVNIEQPLSRYSTFEVSGSRYQSSCVKVGTIAEKSLMRSQPCTPVTIASFQSTTSSSRSATPSTFSPNTPSPQMSTVLAKLQATDAASSSINSSRLSPMYSCCITNGTEPSTAVDGAGPSSKLKLSGSTDALIDIKHKYTNGCNGMLKASSSTNNLVCNGMWSIHCNTNVNNDAVTSSPDLLQADAPLARLKIKINRTSATGSISSPMTNSYPAVMPASAVRKTQKVATTAELIQRLHANGELRLVASETLNRIATNQIEHEADDSNVSIVPEGAKPRPHKRRRTERLPDQLPPAMTDTDLLQVKAERVRSFVQMSADASPTAGDNDLLGLLGRLPVPTSTTMTDDVIQCLEPVMVPTYPISNVLELPSLADFIIDWDSNTYTMPDIRPPPTDADVDRLLSERWPSVNGQYDHRGEWTDWTQSYSTLTYDGSLIHILPYVDGDD